MRQKLAGERWITPFEVRYDGGSVEAFYSQATYDNVVTIYQGADSVTATADKVLKASVVTFRLQMEDGVETFTLHQGDDILRRVLAPCRGD